MNWLTNFVRPKIRAVLKRRDTPENLWVKCPGCDGMIFHRELASALYVCPQCEYHMRLGPDDRLKSIFDDGEFERLTAPQVQADPLNFRDQKKYSDRIREARKKTGQDEAITVAVGEIEGLTTVVAVQNFAFMGGSMGLAVGEAIVEGARAAVQRSAPFVVFAAAGGARMQEGILSLMQMPRTTIAVDMVKEAGLPYIVVLTDPTTGGVTASYGMLGDIHIAEPNALIGFTGQRVIEQTIREKLPEGFQRAEHMLEHGMVDIVVHRHELRHTLSRVLHLLMKRSPNKATKPGIAPNGSPAALPPPGRTDTGAARPAR